MRNTILFIGTFILPDKNAAAIRVTGIAQALILSGYKVIMQGENVSESNDYSEYLGYIYKSRKKWGKLSYYYDDKYVIKTINEIGNDDIYAIIMYHVPAVIAIKLHYVCKKFGIKLIADTTEWYSLKRQLAGGNVIAKAINLWLRIHVSNKLIGNNIVISSYLAKYYKKDNPIIIPILSLNNEEYTERTWNDIKLVYCGSPTKKDLLLPVIDATIRAIDAGSLLQLNVVGCTKYEFESLNGYVVDDKYDEKVIFHGRVEHKKALDIVKHSDFSVIIRPNERYANAGFPTKMVEALSCGVGVVATKTSDIPKYIHNNENGFLLETTKTNELENLLIHICQLPTSEIDNLRKNALKTAREYFDPQKYSETIREYIECI